MLTSTGAGRSPRRIQPQRDAGNDHLESGPSLGMEAQPSETEVTTAESVPCAAPVVSEASSVQRRPKESLSRSRSDLTKRYSCSSDLSELGFKFARNSADLERFFNEMGLERVGLGRATPLGQSSTSLNVFESSSSVASHWDASCSEDGRSQEDHRQGAPPVAAVERRARVLHWLHGLRRTTAGSSTSVAPSVEDDGAEQ